MRMRTNDARRICGSYRYTPRKLSVTNDIPEACHHVRGRIGSGVTVYLIPVYFIRGIVYTIRRIVYP